MNLPNVLLIISTMLMPALLIAAEKDCFSKASTATSKIIEEGYKKNLKANEVNSTTKGIYGAGRWTNGAHFLGESEDIRNKFGESGPYLTYNIKTFVDVNGGRGRNSGDTKKGYRLDPSFEVRVNPDTCEVFKVIYLGGGGDRNLAYPVIGHTVESNGSTKKVYSEAEAEVSDQQACMGCSVACIPPPKGSATTNK